MGKRVLLTAFNNFSVDVLLIIPEFAYTSSKFLIREISRPKAPPIMARKACLIGGKSLISHPAKCCIQPQSSSGSRPLPISYKANAHNKIET